MRGFISMVLATSLLSACVTTNGTKAPVTPAPAPDPNNPKPVLVHDTRLYVRDQCIVTGSNQQQAGLGSALLGVLTQGVAKNAFSSLAAWIKKRGEAQKKQYSGTDDLALYIQLDEFSGLALNAGFNCITLVSGKFDANKTNDIDSYDTQYPEDLNPRGAFGDADTVQRLGPTARVARLNANGVPVHEADLIYEARIAAFDDDTAFHLESQYLEVNKLKSGTDPVGFVISFTLNGPSTDGNANTLTGTLMNFGKISPGAVFRASDITATAFSKTAVPAFNKGKGDRSILLAMPGISEASAQSYTRQSLSRLRYRTESRQIDAQLPIYDAKIDAAEQAGNAELADQLRLARTRLTDRQAAIIEVLNGRLANTNFMPITVSASVTEAGDEKKALLFIAKVLEGSSEALATKVTEHISPDAREAAEVAAATKEAELETALGVARVALAKAKLAVETASTGTATAQAVAQVELEVAADACRRARQALDLSGDCE